MITAQLAWELADATAGRFRLGLGTQVRAHIVRRYDAPFDHPGPRLREYVKAVRACFAAFRGEAPLAYEGEFYKLSLLPAQWSPGAIDVPDPPIDIAWPSIPTCCAWPAEVADGIHVHPLNHPAYIEATVLPNLRVRAERADRDPDALEVDGPGVHRQWGQRRRANQTEREAARRTEPCSMGQPELRVHLRDAGSARDDRAPTRTAEGGRHGRDGRSTLTTTCSMPSSSRDRSRRCHSF